MHVGKCGAHVLLSPASRDFGFLGVVMREQVGFGGALLHEGKAMGRVHRVRAGRLGFRLELRMNTRITNHLNPVRIH